MEGSDYTKGVRSKWRYFGLILVSIAGNLLFIQPAQASLYAFTSHTFTNCSTTGATGPTQTACKNAYSTSWDDSNSNFTVSDGIQNWVVPFSGTYTITTIGAGGASPGGRPASMTGNFSLTQGSVIKILVGQLGTVGYGRGSGGGTFVVNNLNSPLIVGGGGGGGNYNNANTGGNASIVADPGSSSGDATAANASGGCGMNGGGGGGFSSDGSAGAKSFLNGGTGGNSQPGNCATNAPGGFGGGGTYEINGNGFIEVTRVIIGGQEAIVASSTLTKIVIDSAGVMPGPLFIECSDGRIGPSPFYFFTP